MFKVLTKGCEPTRGTKYSACVDLYASEDVIIGAGETKLVGLGVTIDERWLYERDFILNAVRNDPLSLYFMQTQILESKVSAFKKKHYLQLMLRSSLGKQGLTLPNGVGIIDLDYRDEIKMIIHNPITAIEFYQEENEVVELGANGVQPDGIQFYQDKYAIKKGDKIAQITLLEHKGYLFGIESEVDRDGGFGSTDKEEA